MGNRLGVLNDNILVTLYEARSNNTKVSKALRSIRANSEDLTQALLFLDKEGYIEKNNDYCEETQHYDTSHIVTEKGIEYLETNNLI